MAALMYVELPDYAAILFRRTFADLALEGALMDRARDWLGATVAKWRANEKRWEFPSGSTLTFGYMDGPNDWRRYDSAEFQAVLFDEASQFRPHDINAMQGRLRRPKGSRVPIRLRLGSNPGGEAHEFLGERYVNPTINNPERAFVPALFEDNPYLDIEEYAKTLESLKDLDPILYRQRRFGEWIRDESDTIFHAKWWDDNRYDPEDARLQNRSEVRFAALDTANTINETSAYSALAVGDLQPEYTMLLRYMARERLEFPELVEWTVDELAPFARDGNLKAFFIEDAASGKQLIQTLLRSGPVWLRPLIVPVKPNPVKDGKRESWKSASVWMKRRMMPLPHPSASVPWLHDLESELFSVPNSAYKDQADSVSMLVNGAEERYGVFSRRWRGLMERAA